MNDILNYCDDVTADNIKNYIIYNPVTFEQNGAPYFPVLCSTSAGNDLRFILAAEIAAADLPQPVKNHLINKQSRLAATRYYEEALQPICDEQLSDVTVWLANNQPSQTNHFTLSPSANTIIPALNLTTCGCF